MCSLAITALLVISEITYIAMETESVPLLNDQGAPLVAIINTRNIKKQILQSLNEPVHQLINATIDEMVDNLIRGKLAESENKCEQRIHLIEQKIGANYVRWGRTTCEGENTETVYTGQVGGGHYASGGASVNYICLPNSPDAAEPLKPGTYYALLYGGEYEVYDHNKPTGMRSGLGNQDVPCAVCNAKGKTSALMIPGRSNCYQGWTKEYNGYLMAGYHGHPAASEYACVDKDAETITGGSANHNGVLFYAVKTVCGSLKCPPYSANTDVPCAVCTK